LYRQTPHHWSASSRGVPQSGQSIAVAALADALAAGWAAIGCMLAPHSEHQSGSLDAQPFFGQG
jgi:hypothetical protein